MLSSGLRGLVEALPAPLTRWCFWCCWRCCCCSRRFFCFCACSSRFFKSRRALDADRRDAILAHKEDLVRVKLAVVATVTVAVAV